MLQIIGFIVATYTLLRCLQISMRVSEPPLVRAAAVVGLLVTAFLTYVLMTSGVPSANPYTR